MTPEVRKKLSDALKAKWASGTRKKNPPEAYVKASATHKALYASGARKPPGLTSEQARERQAMYPREKMMEVNRRVGEMQKGVPNPPGPSSATPDNWAAKYWILKAPTQEILEGKNLNYLVRTNAHLFIAGDLVWVKGQCRATKGLRGLFDMKKDGSGPKNLSWKGWMIGDRRDVAA